MPQMPRTANPKSLKPHPLAHLIPNMRHSEWQDFYNDIALRGIKVPLEVLADGTVLDGRHRLRAAIELAMKEVPIVDAPLNGDSPVAYMLKAAVLRRHLTDDQRAMMAAFWKEGNKREPELGKRDEKGRFKPSAPRRAEGLVDSKLGPTRAAALDLFKVPRRKVEKADKLRNKSPVLALAVRDGEKTLVEATREAKIQDERMAPKLKRLQEIEEQGIFIGSVWDFGPRANYAGDPNFHGNCIPQVVENAILYYTKPGDIILDPMAGSGTTFDVCEKLDRHCIALDIKRVREEILEADARDLRDGKVKIDDASVDFVFLHPPYWKLVIYTKADDDQRERDLSRLSYAEFITGVTEVIKECYRVLKPDKVLCLLIGDLVSGGQYIPVAIPTYNEVSKLMTPIGVAIKTTEGSKSQVLKGKTVWAEVAYTHNLKIQHDFVMLFRKDGVR